MKSAPLTIRGPRSPRGALWDSEGVLNSGSGGSVAVNVCDLGSSCNETRKSVPLLTPLAAPLVRRAVMWARRKCGSRGRCSKA